MLEVHQVPALYSQGLDGPMDVLCVIVRGGCYDGLTEVLCALLCRIEMTDVAALGVHIQCVDVGPA